MADTTGETNREKRSEREQLAPKLQPRASKLRPARTQLELVERTALLDALLRSPASLVVVTAPAGYGKSTLLAQWADAVPVPAAWLQLDATDNDPVVFLTYLTAALGRVAPVDPAVADLLQEQSPPIDELILPRLGDALDAAQPFLLVLDDAHLVQSEACWRHLALLLEQLPPGARLALGTRSEVPLPLARLRAAGRLAELGLGDLRLTHAEAAELLRLHGSEADDEALNGLLELTEGWATGLYLALLAGNGRPAREWLSHLRGDLHVIAGYLTAEVIERQPAELQEFLLRTSILDQLCPGLCRAVTGSEDAPRLLDRLARDNLFVVALDDRDQWHRYHHLFAELLRTRSSSAAHPDERAATCIAARPPGTRANGDRRARRAPRRGGRRCRRRGPSLAAAVADDYLNRGQLETRASAAGRGSPTQQIYAHTRAGAGGLHAGHRHRARSRRVQRWRPGGECDASRSATGRRPSASPRCARGS